MTSPDSLDPHDLLQTGRLSDALEAQTRAVRARPADMDARYLLFVLLTFAGELERASAALNVIAQREPKLETQTILLRSLLAAEDERRRVFHRAGEPMLPSDAPQHVVTRLRAFLALRRGDRELAEKELSESEAVIPALSGRLEGAKLETEPHDVAAFGAIRDDDDLLGPVLEVFVSGRYLWLPFEQIRSLRAEAPRTWVDQIWIPARLESVDGAESSVYLPALYEGSYRHADEAVRMGRRTEWLERAPEIFCGAGQKVLRMACEPEPREVALLGLRALEIVPASDGLESAAATSES